MNVDELYGPKSTDNEMRVALVGWGLPEFGDYARFYWHAGGCLIEQSQAERSMLTQLVFPILYLYRHALELALKDANVWIDTAILAAGSLGSVDQTQVMSVDAVREEIRMHRLGPLLRRLQARSRLLRDSSVPQVAPLDLEDRVGPAVRALEIVDVDGQRFRYPHMTNGKASWTREEHSNVVVDVLAVRHDADRALAYLLGDLAGVYSSFVEDVFENERLDLLLQQSLEAHYRAMRVQALWKATTYGGADSDADLGYSGFVDDLNAELSEEMLDAGPDT
ncbi:MAG: hypothetical protein M3P18_20050 [Actinomycetota bacterium]|nr:hypothetical protein [Actinomycetota bacterium]